MIHFACPQCRHTFHVEARVAGREAQCSGCGATITIPLMADSDDVGHSVNRSPAPATPARPQRPRVNSPVRPLHDPPAGVGNRPSYAPPSTHASSTDEDPAGLSVKTIGLIIGAACIVAITVLVWFFVGRDRWELKNSTQLTAKLAEADRIQQSEPLKAYQTYDEILKEAQQHTIKDERFSKTLANAEKSRTALFPKVQEQIRAEEAEKQQRAQEEARNAAAEKQRLAKQEQRQRAADEAQRIAAENRRAEEKRRKEAVSVYRDAPQSARTALNVAKKLAARTEVGLNYRDYSTVVGEGYADIKVFAESPEGKSVPEFGTLLLSAMAKYKLALDVWQGKFQRSPALPSEYRFDEGLSDIVLRECWRAAAFRVKFAESLISKDNDEIAGGLSRAAALRKLDESYEATIRSLFPELITANLYREMAKLQPDNKDTQDKFKALVKKMGETIASLIRQDTQEP